MKKKIKDGFFEVALMMYSISFNPDFKSLFINCLLWDREGFHIYFIFMRIHVFIKIEIRI